MAGRITTMPALRCADVQQRGPCFAAALCTCEPAALRLRAAWSLSAVSLSDRTAQVADSGTILITTVKFCQGELLVRGLGLQCCIAEVIVRADGDEASSWKAWA